jgi:hypothetical protein
MIGAEIHRRVLCRSTFKHRSKRVKKASRFGVVSFATAALLGVATSAKPAYSAEADCGNLYNHRDSILFVTTGKSHSSAENRDGWTTVGEYYNVAHAHGTEIANYTMDHKQDGAPVHATCGGQGGGGPE